MLVSRFLLLLPVPGQHLSERQLPSKNVQCAPHCDVHLAIPSNLHPFQVVLLATELIIRRAWGIP